ncbi:MAG: hypothetical protein ACOC31_02775 [Bacteroidota bacterium]
MNISHLNVGIIHSLIGKNDGVSIVIDQTINAMVKDIGINLGNIFFLAAHSSPRFNAETDDVFWHKNEVNKAVLQYFSDPNPPEDLDDTIHEYSMYAKEVIKKFINTHSIDLIIAHNTSHPYNFITAVGLGYLIEELRSEGIIWPKLMVWWHDSYFERERFKTPNKVIKKYLKYLPGTYIDGIAFINNGQPELAKKLFTEYGAHIKDKFFQERAIVVPNTSDIPWEWHEKDWKNGDLIYPPQDSYNDSLFHDIGLEAEVRRRGFTMNDTIVLLQHTRVVPRKKIELAIDYAFAIEERFKKDNKKKCIALLVSGHSGDEQVEYKKFLIDYYQLQMEYRKDAHVVLIFGESHILSHRDIIVDKKYYKFAEIPSVVAAYGGLGTYFSEVEGYGNNLLEMISFGLPAVINRYEVYKTDIEQLGFNLPFTDDCILTDELVDRGYEILTNNKVRNEIVLHNLKVLRENLDHKIIADMLKPLIGKMFTRILT